MKQSGAKAAGQPEKSDESRREFVRKGLALTGYSLAAMTTLAHGASALEPPIYKAFGSSGGGKQGGGKQGGGKQGGGKGDGKDCRPGGGGGGTNGGTNGGANGGANGNAN